MRLLNLIFVHLRRIKNYRPYLYVLAVKTIIRKLLNIFFFFFLIFSINRFQFVFSYFVKYYCIAFCFLGFYFYRCVLCVWIYIHNKYIKKDKRIKFSWRNHKTIVAFAYESEFAEHSYLSINTLHIYML